jgi:hypothetical protein
MHLPCEAFLRWWLRRLSLQRQPSASWHRDRIKEELFERRRAHGTLSILSETSDVLFSFARSRHDGFCLRRWPVVFNKRYLLIFTYMLVKYTSRYTFYRTAGIICRGPGPVREVVNPIKDRNLDQVSIRHGINQRHFRTICLRLRRIWPLPP